MIYLTGEDLGYKRSEFEQAKFDYSPLGKFFNKGLKEEDKKEGLLKRLKNIEDKSEEQLEAFSKIKLVGLQKMKVTIIITINLLFTCFTDTLKNF